METLRRVVASMRDGGRARRACEIVTGDTKVVDRGKGDGIFINTAGIGLVPPGIDISPRRVARRRRRAAQRRPGPARHGRHVGPRGPGLRGGAWKSDCAPLAGLVEAMLAGRRRSALPPRPHPRRPGRGPERDRRGRRRGHRAGRGGHPRDRAGGRRPASCWGSIRSTWPTRAGWWPWPRPRPPPGLLQIMRSHPAAPQAGADRPGHGRASRHGRLAKPPGRRADRRSALRRADAADLLTGRTRSIRHTLGGPDSLAIGVPQAQEAVAAYGGSSCGFAVCDCQAEGVREFRRDDTNENQASGVEDTTPRRQAAKAQRYERERGRRSKLAVGRRFANYLFFLCGLAAWRLCVRDFSP